MVGLVEGLVCAHCFYGEDIVPTYDANGTGKVYTKVLTIIVHVHIPAKHALEMTVVSAALAL